MVLVFFCRLGGGVCRRVASRHEGWGLSPTKFKLGQPNGADAIQRGK